MLIHLAGMTVDVKMRYRYTAELCRPYMAPEGATADFSIAVDDDDLAYEASKNVEAGVRATRDLLENAALYRKLCHAALDRDVLLFHGSALTLDGNGYLFTAPSGTGKSTHAALWRAVWGDRVLMVNDDKPLLRVTDTGVLVSGTPWDGKHHLSAPGDYPLRAICLLERGEENRIYPMTSQEIYPALLGQTYRPEDPLLMMKTLALLDRAMQHLKFYKMICTISPEAARVAYRGMGGQE